MENSRAQAMPAEREGEGERGRERERANQFLSLSPSPIRPFSVKYDLTTADEIQGMSIDDKRKKAGLALSSRKNARGKKKEQGKKEMKINMLPTLLSPICSYCYSSPLAPSSLAPFVPHTPPHFPMLPSWISSFSCFVNLVAVVVYRGLV